MNTTSAWRLLLLAATVMLSACASSGLVPPQAVCPQVPPLPERLAAKTNYAERVSREFYETLPPSSQSETRP